MAGRGRATFQKRQKELKRLEKQKAKQEQRVARKAEKALRGDGGPEIEFGSAEEMQPILEGDRNLEDEI
jgi:hypothetical protein